MNKDLFDLQLLEGNQALPANTQIIDFGIGKIAITLQPGCSIVLNELVDALQEIAMTVPLQRVVDNIKRSR